MKKPLGVETGFNIVLSVSPDDEDRPALERIFKSNWTVVAGSGIASILSVLREIPIPIVICDCDISFGFVERDVGANLASSRSPALHRDFPAGGRTVMGGSLKSGSVGRAGETV